jgi:uncharacterized YceG family protein
LSARALGGLAIVLVIVTGGLGAAVYAVRGRTSKPPPVTTVAIPTFRVIFPEGFTRTDMIGRVAFVAHKADHEAPVHVKLSPHTYALASERAVVPCFGKKPQSNLEGFLFPSTYDFAPVTKSRQLVHDQLATFCANWRTVNMAYARSKNLTNYDVLKIASMIEEEVAVPRERALVSAVIYNRLHDRMDLGIDATLRYGLHIPPTQSITDAELASSNPYNTGNHYGLPPTPIANPGLPSIRAAAHPAHVPYLYYARIPGTDHQYFTASYTAFQQFLATHGYGPHG